ncbi:MAG TPA: ABC-type transport auxiliary lipoprotein family protein [Syntrophales bacterium]|nr:ABC-type transport auxiliary lipoprotein family protein [Syntrophales bacterium]
MRRILLICLVALLALSSIWGCGSAKSTYTVRQYLLEYAPPVSAGLPKTGEVLRVEMFSTAQAYGSTAMYYRPSAFELNPYSRERWRVTPGEMVTDFLLRDLRNSGTFKAVLSYDDPGEGCFTLTGTVVEFLEVDGAGGPVAQLSVDVTLLDVKQREITRRVVFQKTYTINEAMKEKAARSLAESMSLAMKKFSAELMTDIHRGAENANAIKAP